MLIYQVSLRYEISKAQLLMRTIPAQVKVETERNGFRMQSDPIRIQIDNSGFFQSIGIKPVSSVLKESAASAQKAVLAYMCRHTNEKNAKLGPNAKTIAEIANSRIGHTVWSRLDFIPKEGPCISWEGGGVDIEYEKDERKVDMTPARIEFEYIPYKVEIFAEIWLKEFPPEEITVR
jgi:hypothetical protein